MVLLSVLGEKVGTLSDVVHVKATLEWCRRQSIAELDKLPDPDIDLLTIHPVGIDEWCSPCVSSFDGRAVCSIFSFDGSLVQILFIRLDIGLGTRFRSQELSDCFSLIGQVNVSCDFDRDDMILVPLDKLESEELVSKGHVDKKEVHDLAHLFSDIANDIPRMQLNKRLPDVFAELIDARGMTPVRIVHTGENDVVISTTGRTQQHVRSIQRVNEVGRHG